MKRFYSVKLKEKQEQIPPYVAKHLLRKESPLIEYLAENKALKFVHRKKTNILDCYGEEKYLMIGKLKYPNIWGRKTRMGFMELYLNMRIRQQMSLSRGST
ncbi:MAG: hypothetical protein CBD08_000100 [Cellvibrionales bacterium TMED148]|nr:hypothetical protein [Porticoccaceae bacterium]RPG94173.1 MAG: hypothetical protein CBD08_000100 [Cellvibrionales bacterium TMED148]